jgi:sugar phosphate isomerase/epimerase
MPIGIQLYTVGQELQKDVSGTLKQIREIGYTEVETAGFAGLTAKQFRAELDKAGLNCHSAHLQWNSPDLSPVFADAQALGVHFVVSSGLFPPGEGAQPTVDAYKKMAAHINDIARGAQRAGLQYAYHNHNFEFKDLGDGKIGYDVLLAETDPSLVDFELDCGWTRRDTARFSTSRSILSATRCCTSRILSEAAGQAPLWRGSSGRRARNWAGVISITGRFLRQLPGQP